MEEAAGIQGWELLHGAGAGAAPPPVAAVDAYVGIEGESIGAIQLDYFSLDSESRYSRQVLSNGDGEGDSLPDSENPSWVDPESDSRFLGEPSAAGGFPRADVAGFWTSDESSDGQEVISPRGDLEGFDLDVGEGEEIWDFGGVVDGGGESVDLSAGGSPVSGVISESREEINPGAGDLGHFTAGQGGKPGTPWWKLPVELLKFYVLRIRPLWSFSFAAALVGLVILKRRMYKKKPKIRSVPINLTLEDKKNSQFLVRASRLNEAFAVVKRVPMIRSTLPTMGVTPWPVVALRPSPPARLRLYLPGWAQCESSMVGPPQNSFEGRARPFGVLCAPWRKPDESRLETVEMGKGKLRKEEVAEDVCFVCKEGGTLLICEYGDCLKVYHPQCVGKEESFLEAEEIWTCIRHKCFICDKRSRIQCICCPKACCCACVHAAGLIRVGKSKGFCSCCLELLILAKEKENIDPEGKQDLDYSKFPEFLVMGYWNQIKEQGMMSSEDLHRAEGLLKKERTEEQWASRAKNEKWLRIKRSRVKKRVFRGWGSVELIEFLTSLGKDATQPLDQWDVYNIIQEYVHKNNLSLPNRKKKVILCDKKLLPLFGKVKVKVPKIFNLLEGHFAASASSEEESFDVESEKKRMILEPSTRMIRGRFASMVGDNLKLVYLRKSLIVELLSDPQTFERKVIGCFVRIKNDLKGVDFSPDKAFLLRKVSGVEGMGVDIVLSVFHCSKTICVSMLSDDDFEEGECEDLRQLIQKGEFERPTLVEFEEKARAVHQDIMNHWIKREILLLQRKIERANEKGWGREKLELIERRALLQTGSERERLLKEIPRVMTDEDENYR